MESEGQKNIDKFKEAVNKISLREFFLFDCAIK